MGDARGGPSWAGFALLGGCGRVARRLSGGLLVLPVDGRTIGAYQSELPTPVARTASYMRGTHCGGDRVIEPTFTLVDSDVERGELPRIVIDSDRNLFSFVWDSVSDALALTKLPGVEFGYCRPKKNGGPRFVHSHMRLLL